MLIEQDALFALIGYLGVAIYLGAYVALQLGFIPGTGYWYASLNLGAAVCVLISLTNTFNMASAMVQTSWIVISVVGITRSFLISRHLVFNEDEKALLRHGLPGTPTPVARRILNKGVWIDADEGFRLTVEGEPVEQLYFLSKGHADVLVADKHVATIDTAFVGEMNVLEGGPASATVELTGPARLFCLHGDTLRSLSRRDAEASAFLERNLNASTRHKLVQANQKLSGRS